MKQNKKLIPKRRFKEFKNNHWIKYELGKVIEYEQPTKYIVQDEQYSNFYRIPVLTAGKSFLLGYTNENFGIYYADNKKPVLVFDDFTTALQYVSFPFKIKSSAIKLLTLRDEKKDYLYCIYYAIKNINYNVKTHNRHWISLFAKISISLPNYKEQYQIGEFFKKLDNLINLQKKKIEKLNNLKSAYLSDMFPKEGKHTPQLRFKEFQNNDEWKKLKLHNITSLITKGTTPLDKLNNGTINFIKIESIDPMSNKIIYTFKITEQEHMGYLKRSQLQEHDILFSIAGTLGRIAIVESSILPANTNQALAIIRLNQGDIKYITIYLQGKYLKNYIAENITVGAQPNLSLAQIKNIIIYLPQKNEQIKIGEFFKKLDTLINVNEAKLQKLENLKQAYLNEMFI